MRQEIDERRVRRDGREEKAPVADRPHSSELLGAAFALHSASERLAALDAESRAVARLATEALLRGDVSPAALALVANIEGRSGLLHLLRGSASAQPS